MKEIPFTQGKVAIVDGDEQRATFERAPAIAFNRIVVACLDLEWQILPRVYQRVAMNPEQRQKSPNATRTKGLLASCAGMDPS